MMQMELILKPGNHEGFRIKEEGIWKPRSHEEISIGKSSDSFSWIPGFQIISQLST
jgi:hypothetical protein